MVLLLLLAHQHRVLYRVRGGRHIGSEQDTARRAIGCGRRGSGGRPITSGCGSGSAKLVTTAAIVGTAGGVQLCGSQCRGGSLCGRLLADRVRATCLFKASAESVRRGGRVAYRGRRHTAFDGVRACVQTETAKSLGMIRTEMGNVIPEPEPELVELELLPGEGVPGSGDRARAAESTETTN